MSEVSGPSFQEMIDMLPEGCRGCGVARFTLNQLTNTDQDRIPVVEDIKAKCNGWKSGEEPPESVLAVDGDPAFSLPAAIDQNCSYYQASKL